MPRFEEVPEDVLQTQFGAQLEEASRAFVNDPTYLADMVERGAQAAYQEMVWSARVEVRAVSERASTRRAAPLCFMCPENLCGFGQCAKAEGEYRKVEAQDVPGAVKALLRKRGVERPSRFRPDA